MENRKGANRVLVRRPKGKRPLGRPRHTWEDNIKMGLLEAGWGWGAWTGLIWLRIGHTGGSCECGNIPLGSIKCK
jgi:hypothetical protein